MGAAAGGDTAAAAGAASSSSGGAGTAGGTASSGGAGTASSEGAGTAEVAGAGTASSAVDGVDRGAAVEGVRRAAVEGVRGAAVEGDQGADVEARPEWMATDSTYLLKIKLVPNPKKARKEISGFCFDKVVDSDFTNFKDLIQSIVDEYPPRYLEVAHFQYYDDCMQIFPEVKSDQQLMSMFDKHSKTKVVQIFIAYCDPTEPYEPITEPYEHIQPENNIEQDEDNYLQNPIPENEHVGIDEENLYLEKEPAPLTMVLFSDKEKDKDYVPVDESSDESVDESVDESGDESVDESEDEPEVEEDEELHEAEHAPNIEYNKEDPPMTQGSKYPNMEEFKLALSQHAVKHEFEYNITKSAPHRFRGYCKRRDKDDCPWTIYASVTDDLPTVVVRKNM